jgi:hypothetical protein
MHLSWMNFKSIGKIAKKKYISVISFLFILGYKAQNLGLYILHIFVTTQCREWQYNVSCATTPS